MIPFGPKLNTVFASRWKALVVGRRHPADGVLLGAIAPSKPRQTDAKAQAQAEQPAHRNPWALDTK